MIRMSSLSSSPPPQTEKSHGRSTKRSTRNKPMRREDLEAEEPRKQPMQHPPPRHPSSSPHHTPLRSLTNIGKIIRLSSLDQKRSDMGDSLGSTLLKDALKTPNDFKLQPGKITRVQSSKPEVGTLGTTGGSLKSPTQFQYQSGNQMPLLKSSWKRVHNTYSLRPIPALQSIRLSTGETLRDPYLRHPYQFMTLSKKEALKIWKHQKSEAMKAAKRELQNRCVKPIQPAQQFGRSTVFNPFMHVEFIERLHNKNSERIFMINLISKEKVYNLMIQLWNYREKLIEKKQEIFDLRRELAKKQVSLKRKKMIQEKRKFPVKKNFTKAQEQIQQLQVRMTLLVELKHKYYKLVEWDQLQGIFCAFKIHRELGRSKEVLISQLEQNRTVCHFYLSAWLHFKELKKCRRDMLLMAGRELARSRAADILERWKRLKQYNQNWAMAKQNLVISGQQRRIIESLYRLRALPLIKRRHLEEEAILQIYLNSKYKSRSLFGWRLVICKQRSIKAKARRLLNKGQQEAIPPYEMESLLWERLDYQNKVVNRKVKKHQDQLSSIRERSLRLKLEKCESFTHLFDELRLKVQRFFPMRTVSLPSPHAPLYTSFSREPINVQNQEFMSPMSIETSAFNETRFEVRKPMHSPVDFSITRANSELNRNQSPFKNLSEIDKKYSIHYAYLRYQTRNKSSEHYKSQENARLNTTTADITSGRLSFQALVTGRTGRIMPNTSFSQAQFYSQKQEEPKQEQLIFHEHFVMKKFFDMIKKIRQKREAKAEDFKEYIECKRAFSLFRKWRRQNKRMQERNQDLAEGQRKRSLLRGWFNQIYKKGQKLKKRMKALTHYCQNLQTKSLIAFVHYNERQKKRKAFERISLKRVMLRKWASRTNSKLLLKRVFRMRQILVREAEEAQHFREFKLMQSIVQNWRDYIVESENTKKQRLEKRLALQHYRTLLRAKYFQRLTQKYRSSVFARKANQIVLKKLMKPIFEKWVDEAISRLQRVRDYQTQRKDPLLKCRVFCSWRSYVYKEKVASLFHKSRILQKWSRRCICDRVVFPRAFRNQVVKRATLRAFKVYSRDQWNEKRGNIIARAFLRKKEEKMKKTVMLLLLENILTQKEKRIRSRSSNDFYKQTLLWNAFNGLRRYNKQRKEKRVLNRQADLFRAEMMRRREYFRNQRQEWLPSHMQYNNSLDESNEWELKSRSMAGWTHLTRKHKMLRGLCERFKKDRSRLIITKHFLSWLYSLRFKRQSVASLGSLDDGTLSFRESLFASQNTGTFDRRREGEGTLEKISGESPKDLLKELDSIFEQNRRWLQERKQREKMITGIIKGR